MGIRIRVRARAGVIAPLRALTSDTLLALRPEKVSEAPLRVT